MRSGVAGILVTCCLLGALSLAVTLWLGGLAKITTSRISRGYAYTGYVVELDLPRLIGFLVPVSIGIALLAWAAVATFRYRARTTDRKGRSPHAVTRWAVWISVTALAGVLAVVAGGLLYVGIASSKKAITALSATVIALGILGVVVLCIRVMASGAFRARLGSVALAVVAASALLGIPFASGSPSPPFAQSPYQSGFRVLVPHPDPIVQSDAGFTCGDAFHCLVWGGAAGLPGRFETLHLATTANGGTTWRDNWIEITLRSWNFRFTCSVATCRALINASTMGLSGLDAGTGILTVTIESDGMPSAAFEPVRWDRPGFIHGACWSALDCVTVTTAKNRNGRPSPAGLTTARLTMNAGTTWRTMPLPLPVGLTDPTAIELTRLWCSPSGSCATWERATTGACPNGQTGAQVPRCQERTVLLWSAPGATRWVATTVPRAFGSLVEVDCPAVSVCTAEPTFHNEQATFPLSADGGSSWTHSVSLGRPVELGVCSPTLCVAAVRAGTGTRQAQESGAAGTGWKALPVHLRKNARTGLGCAESGPCSILQLTSSRFRLEISMVHAGHVTTRMVPPLPLGGLGVSGNPDPAGWPPTPGPA